MFDATVHVSYLQPTRSCTLLRYACLRTITKIIKAKKICACLSLRAFYWCADATLVAVAVAVTVFVTVAKALLLWQFSRLTICQSK